MSKKVVVIHAEHRFVGYKSDVDYAGNASFCDDLIMVAYIPKDKARKFVRGYARKTGMQLSHSGLYAHKKPEDPRYPSEHEYIETCTPSGFLFKYGTLGYGLEEAKKMLGKIAPKDLERYMREVQVMCEEYDPF